MASSSTPPMPSSRRARFRGGRRLRYGVALFSIVAVTIAGPAGVAAADPSGGASSGSGSVEPSSITLPGATTTTTVPATTSTTTGQTTTTTTTTTKANNGPGVPSVPVAGPPTTTPAKSAKGATPTTPAPQPSVAPILSQVDSDLAQLDAINEYKPAQALVSTAQGKVTIAGAALLTARQAVTRSQFYSAVAQSAKAHADEQLRDLALAAYMGVGASGLAGAAGPDGNQGEGTVSTPFGLSGMNAIDADELLVLVGQHAKQNDDDAAKTLTDVDRALDSATKTYRADQVAVTGAENGLINAQQTLETIATAATTPGAAAAGSLPPLQLDDAAQPAGSAPSTSTSTTSTTLQGQITATAQVIGPDINGAPPVSPTILSAPSLNASQLQAWWATLNRQPNLTVPINSLIQSYATWGAKLGVRYDVAFAQSVVETGYFSFPSYGQLTAKDNNFAGIGACDSCATGWSFPSADTGVEAQLELLREYATSAPLPSGMKNVIGSTGVGGCCQTWVQLAGKWASSTTYGISIMTVYQSMLQWLIPQRELTVGLIAPTTAAAQGPELAPLPGSTPPASATSGSKSSTAGSPPQEHSDAAKVGSGR